MEGIHAVTIEEPDRPVSKLFTAPAKFGILEESFIYRLDIFRMRPGPVAYQ
jgi:hypothetical protein